MIRLVTIGLVALAGITLVAGPAAGQQPAAADPAQLAAAKALREDGKFAEAEKLLTQAIGSNDKQGPAFGSLDFRKELARLYESKAATLTGKPANDEWGKSLKEWTTLFQFAQNGLKQIEPDTPPEKVKQLKSRFFDAYFEIQRVLVTANQTLIKDPARLDASYEKLGRQIFNVENLHKFNEVKQVVGPDGKEISIKGGTEIITPEVWTRYCDLLDQNPELKTAYQKAGGKFFLKRPQVKNAPPANDAPPVVVAGPVVSWACNPVVAAPAPRRFALCGPRKAVLGAWFPR